MNPDEILRDALAKIRCSLGADSTRLGQIRAEEVEIQTRIEKGEAAERVLLAAMGEGPAPVVEPPPPATAPEPAPAPAPVAEASLDIPAIVARAIQAAKAVSPQDRTERKIKMLAACAVKCACGLTNREVAEAFGLKAPDVCPAALVEARIFSEEIDKVAIALRGGKADEPGARPLSVAQPEPASPVKPSAPAPVEPSADLRALADDLLNDLPTMLATSPKGIGVAVITDWFGCTAEQAKEAASLLIKEGKAVAPNRLLQLPVGEAVPA